MKKFLKETWELWYWAMFCPSKLQARMNSWRPRKTGRTTFGDILLFSINWRFWGQFFCLICLFSTPLIGLIRESSAITDWLLLPITLLAAYSLGVIFLPIGINTPLLIGGIYQTSANAFSKKLQTNLNEIAQAAAFLLNQSFLEISIILLLISLVGIIIYDVYIMNKNRGARALFIRDHLEYDAIEKIGLIDKFKVSISTAIGIAVAISIIVSTVVSVFILSSEISLIDGFSVAIIGIIFSTVISIIAAAIIAAIVSIIIATL
ncbi:hypothetical protein IQ260_28915, partial [Leptolyngbya cf. ectocarpi LEGE 11479]